MKLSKDLFDIPELKTGIAVIILSEGKTLIGKRKGKHGAGIWAFPGGHIEPTDKNIEECAKREVLEETGLKIECINFDGFGPDLFTTFDIIGNNTKYITLYVIAKLIGGNLENKEPDKCEEWKWVNINDIEGDETWIPIERIKANINRISG